MKNFIPFLFIICSLFHEGINLSDEAYSAPCDKTILEQYNVNPASCSSNFIIKSSTSSYANNLPVQITLASLIPNKSFIGFQVFAQDSKGNNVGSWKQTDSLIESTLCGGLMQSSYVEKTSVDVVWYAPSNAIGDITIKAIVIEDEQTVYVNCYKIILTPQISEHSSFTDRTDPVTNSTTSETTSTISSSTVSTSTSSDTTTTTTVSATSPTTTAEPSTSTSTAQSTTASTSASASTSTSTSILTTTTPGASTTKGPSPVTDVSVNVTWKFNDDTNVTDVYMTVNNMKIGDWAAVGLGLERRMGGAHVFMCKRLWNDTIIVERYINPSDHDHPEHADSELGGLFTPGVQQFNNGVVTCRFTLSDFSPQSFRALKDIELLSQSTNYYPLFAIGILMNTTYEPQKHADDSKTAQNTFVQLDQNVTILYRVDSPDDDDSLKFVRVHGTIMIFAWILIASTGALIARYFKGAWGNAFICGKAAWFAAHRLLMSVGITLTVVAFFFILVYLQGTWVDRGPTRYYAHATTGVIVVAFSFFQPFIALFRCEANSPNRFIFNLIHGFIGFSAFILATATLFLATYFKVLKDTKARVLMIIWIIWMLLVFTIFEVMKHHYRNKSGQSAYSNISGSNGETGEGPSSSINTLTQFPDSVDAASGKKAKNVLLALHILVASIIAIVLAVFLNSSS